jgi:putative holliday junction resolvase
MRLTEKKRILAIDYGTKRIGLAQTDPLQLFASSVGTFDRAGLFTTLQKMVDDNEIEKILVGYPLSGDNSSNAMTEVVDRFILELQLAFPTLCLETVDEHHSSQEARQILIASGKGKKARKEKGRLDSAAACVILRDYLEAHR